MDIADHGSLAPSMYMLSASTNVLCTRKRTYFFDLKVNMLVTSIERSSIKSIFIYFSVFFIIGFDKGICFQTWNREYEFLYYTIYYW